MFIVSGVSRVLVGLRLFEEVGEGGVAFLGGDGEGCFAFEVHCGEVGAALDEELADGEVAFDGGEHEEGPAVLVGGIGVEAGVEGGR